MAAIPAIDESQLQAICDVLGETEGGLTGSEIARYLADCQIVDPCPALNKRTRLYEALRTRQRQDGCGNHVVAFIRRAMNPVLYHSNPQAFAAFRSRLNQPLAFSGYQVNERGEMIAVSAARTLAEADQRANDLQRELSRRQVHTDVLRFCRAELLQDNYFHAVLEATKSLSDKIRQKSGLPGDGGDLAMKAFALGKAGVPFLAFNSLRTETETSEQSGLMNLFIGVFGTFRNVTAHGPKISWNMTKDDALDLLTIVSFLHRRLDAAAPTGRKP